MTILIVSNSENQLKSVRVNGKGQRVATVQTIHKVVDPLPASLNKYGDEDDVTTDWIMKHPVHNLVFALTSFGTKAKSILTTYRVYSCGSLEHLASCPTGGYQACHASINPNGTCLAISHLHCGRVAFFNVQDNAGCMGPPLNVIRLPVVYPYNLLEPHLSTTGLGVPAAHGVSFSPNGEFVCVSEPSQHAVFTYRCNATTGELETREAYKPKPGQPRSNSAFSYVQGETEYDPITWCQNLAIMMGGEWGPKLTRSVLHPSGNYLYALQEQSNSIAVYKVEHSGMIVPKLVQELRVAELDAQAGATPQMCTGPGMGKAGTASATELQAFEDGLILSISGQATSSGRDKESGIRIILYENDDGSRLKLGQHIKTKAPVQHFVRDEDKNTLWIAFASEVKPYVQKYQKRSPSFSSYGAGKDDSEFLFTGQANVGMADVQCLTTLEETDLPSKQQAVVAASIPQQQQLQSGAASSNSSILSDSGSSQKSNSNVARRAKLLAVFLKWDTNGSGYLETKEIAVMLKEAGEPCDEADVEAYTRRADRDKDGKLDFDEFYGFVTGDTGKKKKELSAEESRRKKLKAVFDKRDEDGSGYLEAEEVAGVMTDLMGVAAATPEAVEVFMKKVDQDGDGRIDFEEFYEFATGSQSSKKRLIAKAPKPSKFSPEEARRIKLKKAFDKKDLNGSGYLEVNEIAQVLAISGEPCSASDVAKFIRPIDINGDGRIDFEEFYAFATAGAPAVAAKKEPEVSQPAAPPATPSKPEEASDSAPATIAEESSQADATPKSVPEQTTPPPVTSDDPPATEFDMHRHVMMMFYKYDKNDDGDLASPELVKVLEDLGKPTSLSAVKTFMTAMGKDEEGDTLNFAEFWIFASRKLGIKRAPKKPEKPVMRKIQSKRIRRRQSMLGSVQRNSGVAEEEPMVKPMDEREQLRSAFMKHDKDGSGYLEEAELKALLWEIGRSGTIKNVGNFIRAVDQDGDGKLSFEEFCAFAMAQNKKKSGSVAPTESQASSQQPQPRRQTRRASMWTKPASSAPSLGYQPSNRNIQAQQPGGGRPRAARRASLSAPSIIMEPKIARSAQSPPPTTTTRTFRRPSLIVSDAAGAMRATTPVGGIKNNSSDIRSPARSSRRPSLSTGSMHLNSASNHSSSATRSPRPAPGSGGRMLRRESLSSRSVASSKSTRSSRSKSLAHKSKSKKKLQSTPSAGSSGELTAPTSSFAPLDRAKAQSGPSDEGMEKMKAAFDKYDKNRNGFLEPHEVAKVLKSMGRIDADDEAVAKFIKRVDKNGDGMIDFAEFVRFAAKQSRSSSSKLLKKSNSTVTPAA